MWYQEPRLTYDTELGALSPCCMDLYTLQAVCKQNGWPRLRDFPTNQNSAPIPVLNKQQESTHQTNASFGGHLIDQSEKGLKENETK